MSTTATLANVISPPVAPALPATAPAKVRFSAAPGEGEAKDVISAGEQAGETPSKGSGARQRGDAARQQVESDRDAETGERPVKAGGRHDDAAAKKPARKKRPFASVFQAAQGQVPPVTQPAAATGSNTMTPGDAVSLGNVAATLSASTAVKPAAFAAATASTAATAAGKNLGAAARSLLTANTNTAVQTAAAEMSNITAPAETGASVPPAQEAAAQKLTNLPAPAVARVSTRTIPAAAAPTSAAPPSGQTLVYTQDQGHSQGQDQRQYQGQTQAPNPNQPAPQPKVSDSGEPTTSSQAGGASPVNSPHAPLPPFARPAPALSLAAAGTPAEAAPQRPAQDIAIAAVVPQARPAESRTQAANVAAAVQSIHWSSPVASSAAVRGVGTQATLTSSSDSSAVTSPADQVAAAVRNASAAGEHRVVIRLDPPELGTVRVILQTEGRHLRAVVQVDNPRAMEQLRRETPSLLDRLADQGISVQRMHVGYSHSGGDATSQSPSQFQQSGGTWEGQGQQERPSGSGNSRGEPNLADTASTAGQPTDSESAVVTDGSINVWI